MYDMNFEATKLLFASHLCDIHLTCLISIPAFGIEDDARPYQKNLVPFASS